MFPCGRSKTPDARDLGSTFRSPPVEPVTPVRDQLLEVREVRAVVSVRPGISSGKRVRANRRFRSVSTASGTWILKGTIACRAAGWLPDAPLRSDAKLRGGEAEQHEHENVARFSSRPSGPLFLVPL